MTDDEINELEFLLGKLSYLVKCKYCLVPGIIQDLQHIALYGDDGTPKYTATAVTLREAVADVIRQKFGV